MMMMMMMFSFVMFSSLRFKRLLCVGWTQNRSSYFLDEQLFFLVSKSRALSTNVRSDILSRVAFCACTDLQHPLLALRRNIFYISSCVDDLFLVHCKDILKTVKVGDFTKVLVRSEKGEGMSN